MMKNTRRGSRQLVILCLTVLVTLTFIIEAHSANILFLLVLSPKSHRNCFEPLIQGLAEKGHKITVHSPFPNPKSHSNVKEVFYKEVHDEIENPPPGSDFDPYTLGQTNPALEAIFLLTILAPQHCERALFEYPHLRELKNSKDQYDLVVIDGLANECTFGFSRHFNAPLVLFHTPGPMSWTSGAIGVHDLPSIYPTLFSKSTEVMSFGQRVANTIYTYTIDTMWKYVYLSIIDKKSRRFFGPDVPSLYEMSQEVPLTLLNSHMSVNYPRALPPGAVEVGALHVKPPKPLPKDLQKWADNTGPHGFIYFSFGSIVKGSKMPQRVKDAFLEAFSKIPQQVLWKWETEQMDGQPKNVRLAKWLPQQDVLGHPKLKAFITHGGLLSLQEAAYNGVPVIGMGFFGDQDVNTNRMESQGIGVKLDYKTVTTESILTALNKVISESSYRTNMQQRSAILRDQIETSLERAIWWTEYVIRHKGADHLKLHSRKLNYFQYFLYDVHLFLVAVVVGAFYLLRLVFRKVCCRKKSDRQKEHPKRKENKKTK